MSAVGLALVGVGLTACGQRGALYLPTEAAAKNRATLPELLLPGSSAPDAAAKPAQSPSPASNTPAKKGDAE
ncbi:LPS translocon maturation chaperone LptM [Variovorax flavidus]|uniref:LPS translocon maturation chaperone LptM n=1 Tax=Variovorax flavidus TaxID=3053501 RepID=UPI0033657362